MIATAHDRLHAPSVTGAWVCDAVQRPRTRPLRFDVHMQAAPVGVVERRRARTWFAREVRVARLIVCDLSHALMRSAIPL